jgi:hypothetical protein
MSHYPIIRAAAAKLVKDSAFLSAFSPSMTDEQREEAVRHTEAILSGRSKSFIYDILGAGIAGLISGV